MIQIVPVELLEALAATAKQPEPVMSSHNGNGHGQPFASRLDVARWLTERGRGFKVKDRTTTDSRTVYLLDACPSNPEHKNGEVCIMQGPDGKMSARCFHDSCNGNGWAQFRDSIGKPDPEHYDPPLTRIGSGKGSKTKATITLEPGTLVKAADRGNFGTVVSDNGGSCTVHFVSPDGQTADVDLPKSQLCSQDGKPLVEPDEPPRFITTLMTSAQLDDLAAEPRFIVKNAVPAGQVGAIGAKSKACKTGIATDLIISIASATHFVNEFAVPEAARLVPLRRIRRVENPATGPADLSIPGARLARPADFLGVRFAETLLAVPR